ncbi:hypothetical protein LTR36_003647 [Oleoguttula mirabilis]|uniref:Linalool dehydratase/isomerase domain-containing protein n=1 Tax=Oleoguttula mirabilis TaxID=1507867 RepID=A0AAV9JIT1_9PEZI|nr:hypothetical protein LTR36_003647 [Oleoguttula mirabilis]
MSTGKAVGEYSFVGGFRWKDVLIPSDVATGRTKWYYQRRTLLQYATVASVGLLAFYQLENPSLRAAGLGLLFPGAGLVAVCTIPALISFLLSTCAIPFALFAWFGCGGVAFPIFLWVGTTVLAAGLARQSVLEQAGVIWTAICVFGVSYVSWQTRAGNAEGREKRQKRNEYLVDAVQQNQAAAAQSQPGSREVDETTLRFLQWTLELGLSGKTDFSYHDVIDQFQTSAIRYQLYEAVSGLGCYQHVYAPNFHGYCSLAQRNIIEKSLTKKVMGFWKWESMVGKFNVTDWDPCYKDNIMVSGYVLQAIGIYQGNTGDSRYCEKDSLVFEITDNVKFKYDLAGVADAVYRNMDENPYCLYPCEPNWVYTLCNLVGISGIVATDRLLGNTHGDQIKRRFESSLEKEFSETNGSIIPIRSELTGFTIPGLAGVLNDAINSVLCAAFLPHIAHRNWAFTKRENIQRDAKGKMTIVNMKGADKLDPGNYKPGEGSIRAIVAAAAGEFGDEEIRKEMLRQLDEEYHPVYETRTRALKNKGLSTIEQGVALRARLCRYQDWCKMIQEGLPEQISRGPILDDVPFPEVLVAKAYSHDGESIELVLYNGKGAGTFKLGFIRLHPGKTYTLGNESAVADAQGRAHFSITLDGRTATILAPVL